MEFPGYPRISLGIHGVVVAHYELVMRLQRLDTSITAKNGYQDIGKGH
jgi:hypothetical protein